MRGQQEFTKKLSQIGGIVITVEASEVKSTTS